MSKVKLRSVVVVLSAIFITVLIGVGLIDEADVYQAGICSLLVLIYIGGAE